MYFKRRTRDSCFNSCLNLSRVLNSLCAKPWTLNFCLLNFHRPTEVNFLGTAYCSYSFDQSILPDQAWHKGKVKVFGQ